MRTKFGYGRYCTPSSTSGLVYWHSSLAKCCDEPWSDSRCPTGEREADDSCTGEFNPTSFIAPPGPRSELCTCSPLPPHATRTASHSTKSHLTACHHVAPLTPTPHPTMRTLIASPSDFHPRALVVGAATVLCSVPPVQCHMCLAGSLLLAVAHIAGICPGATARYWVPAIMVLETRLTLARTCANTAWLARICITTHRGAASSGRSRRIALPGRIPSTPAAKSGCSNA